MTTDTIDRFYYHNGPRRASMGLLHDKRSGTILLATTFTHRNDVYTKKTARQLLDSRLSAFMLDTAWKGTLPRVCDNPGAVFVGIYDGSMPKKDIFGPLIDLFDAYLDVSKEVRAIRAELHSAAACLVAYANHSFKPQKNNIVEAINEALDSILAEELDQADTESADLVSVKV